jgi:hypothetical protein
MEIIWQSLSTFTVSRLTLTRHYAVQLSSKDADSRDKLSQARSIVKIVKPTSISRQPNGVDTAQGARE